MSIIFKKSKKDISQVESDKNRLDAMAKELDEMMIKYEAFRGFGEVLSIKTDLPMTDNLNQLLDLRTEQIRELFLDTSQVINNLTELGY